MIKKVFGYFEVPKGFNGFETTQDNTLLFVFEGSIKIICNNQHIMLDQGMMIFYPTKSLIKFHFTNHTQLLKATFNNVEKIYKVAALADLKKYKKNKSIFTPLLIKKEIYIFLDLLKKYLDDGIDCVCFHNLELLELFFLFRFYYTNEELANFLYPIVGTSYQFKNQILKNVEKATTVKALASLCNLSLSAFKQKFKEEFDQPPGEWFKKYRLNQVKYKISNVNLPFKTIADELGFPSISQFSKFCKRHTGLTPTQLRALVIKKESHFLKD